MINRIKQLFCKHKHKRPMNKYTYISGHRAIVHRTECRDCGKVWKL